MAKSKALNDKRLTRKQVLEIIRTEGRFHDEYSSVFKETYADGYVKQDKVYELPGDRFLFVFDEKDPSLPGKGDIYSKEYFDRFIKWSLRIEEDAILGRASSVDHWRYYSKFKAEILEHIDELLVGLSERLLIAPELLNKSYASLDLVSKACEECGVENVINDLYDHLVVYVGEVIKSRVSGHFMINEMNSGGRYPYVAIDIKKIQYMPVNVVWTCLGGLEPVNLRKAAADEVRLVAPRVKYEKRFGEKKIL